MTDPRDLDRLVHERVMGHALPKTDIQRARAGFVHVPAYSADIREAFGVVERMRGEGWLLMLWESTHPDCPVQWSAEFERGGASELEHGQTPAEAIARAALAATEGEG